MMRSGQFRWQLGVLLVILFLPGCGTPPREASGAERAEGGGAAVYVVRRSWHVDIGFRAADLQPPLASLRDSMPGTHYLLFGFGDKHYLLSHGSTFGRLLGAVFPGEGLVMVTPLENTPEHTFGADEVIRLSVSEAQKRDLEAFIWTTFATQNGVAREVGNDGYLTVYYAAATRYSVFHTCNTWAAEALRAAGLPVHTWDVELAGQVWRQVEKINHH